METQLEQLHGELLRQNQEITRLSTIVQALELQNASHTASTSRPKPALPDPEKFAGSSQKFDTWLPSIKAKLRVDAKAIGSNIAQFYYVFLNLEAPVQAMVLPQLNEAEATNAWDYQTILDQLSRVYDNPNKIHEAEHRLYALKQGTDTTAHFVAKFERIDSQSLNL